MGPKDGPDSMLLEARTRDLGAGSFAQPLSMRRGSPTTNTAAVTAMGAARRRTCQAGHVVEGKMAAASAAGLVLSAACARVRVARPGAIPVLLVRRGSHIAASVDRTAPPPVAFPADRPGVQAFCDQCARKDAPAPRKLQRAFSAALEEPGAKDTWTLACVVNALVKAGRSDLAATVHAEHARALGTDLEASDDWCRATARALRACCREGNVTAADMVWATTLVVLAQAARPAARQGRRGDDGGQDDGGVAGSNAARAHGLASSVGPSLVVAHLRAGNVEGALQRLADIPAHPPAGPDRGFGDMLRWFGKAGAFSGVLRTLDLMAKAEAVAGPETLEHLATAAVKSVDFVTGAVSMATLPAGDLPEVAFVGRSNVGKSSLVNMFLGRRALAYTSATPGKTQQFNYFEVNSKAARTMARFFIADLPGVGFAQVPARVRAEWAELLRAYFGGRPNLRAICHLVDGNTGLTPADRALMKDVREHRAAGRYIIVCTKLDRRVARSLERDARARREASPALGSTADLPRPLVQSLRAALRDAGLPEETPIVATSAKTKRGRDEMWRQLGHLVSET